MTTLKDDGYLETDSPVVAACFIGEKVTVLHHSILDDECRPSRYDEDTDDYIEEDLTDTLASVCSDGVWVGVETYADYPILIPAKTVAEVCGWVDVQNVSYERWTEACKPPSLTLHIIAEQTTGLSHWLRTHTKEDTDG